MKRLHKWELALLLGLCAALLWGAWSAQQQEELSRKMIRLHVIAHSDSTEDQALKLQVRDAVLDYATAVLQRSADMAAAQQELQRELGLVRTLTTELTSLREANPARAGERRSLSALVDQSLQGRPFQPARIQLNEAGQLQLRLENVVFDDALSWLQELENYPGVLASALSVTREESGRVSLGLTLQQL